MQEDYKADYEQILTNYRVGATDQEIIGLAVARFGQYFSNYNSIYGEALIIFNKKAVEIEMGTDENGKVISSTKAKVVADATIEAEILIRAKINKENVESNLNALKSLQKSLSKEYGYSV